MKTLKTVLLGFGRMGQKHFRAISKHSRLHLSAILDPKWSDANWAGSVDVSGFNGKKITTVSELKNLDWDLAVISTATESHFEILKELIPFKKPILCEKPVVSQATEAKQLKDLLSQTPIPLAIGHIERYNPAIQKFKQILTEKKLGTIHHIHFNRSGTYPATVSPKNNVLLDLAIHDFDLIRFLWGETKVTYSQNLKIKNPKIIDSADVLFKTDQGVSGLLHADWLSPSGNRFLRVLGEKGMCFVDFIQQKIIFDHFGKSGSDIPEEFEVTKVDQLTEQMNDFIRFIQSEKNEICSLEDGTQALELVTQATNH